MEETQKKFKGVTYSFDPKWAGKGAWRILTKKGKLGIQAPKDLQKRWGNPNDQGVYEEKKTEAPKTNTEKLKESVQKTPGLKSFTSLVTDPKESLGSATLKYVKQQFRPEVLAKTFFGDAAGAATAKALKVSQERMQAVTGDYDEKPFGFEKEKKTSKKKEKIEKPIKETKDSFEKIQSTLKESLIELKAIKTKLYGENTIAVKFSKTSESSKDLDTIADYFLGKQRKEDIEDNFAETRHNEQVTLLKKIASSIDFLRKAKDKEDKGIESGGGGGLDFPPVDIDLDRRRGGRGRTTAPSAPRPPRTPGRLGRFFRGLGAVAGLGAVGAAGTAMVGTRAPETRTIADVDNRALLESEENRKKAVAEAEEARNKAALEAENAKKIIEKTNADNAKAIQDIENKSKQTVADVEQRSKTEIEKAQIEKNKAIADAEQKTKAAIEKVEAEKTEINKKAKEAVEKANADKNMAVQEKEKAIAEANAEKEKAIAEANNAKEKAIAEANAEKEKTIAEKEKAIKDVEAEKQKAIAEANDAKEKAIVEANEAKQKAITEANEKVSNLEKAKAEADAKLSEFEKTAVKTTPEAGKVTPPPAATGVTPSPTAAAITTPPAATGVTPTTTTTPTAAAVPEKPTAGLKVGKAAKKIIDGLGPVGDIIGIALAISAIEAARSNATASVVSGQMSEDDAEKQFKKETVSILSGEVGGFAGGVLGAIAGQMMIPIPILGGLIGGVLGGVTGGMAGEAMGEKLYDFLTSGGEMPDEDEINNAKKLMYESRKGMAGYDEYGAKKVDPDVMRLRESIFGMELTGNKMRKQQEVERYEREKQDAMRVMGAPGATPAPPRTRAAPPATQPSRTSVERMSVDDGMSGALITPASFTPPTTNMAEKVSANAANVPRAEGQQLGFMAKQYESGKAGSAAIGYDTTGGSSYGAYQIATKTGTMNRFMQHLKETNPEAYERLSAAGDPNVPGGGKFGQEWKKLAAEGKLQQSEHEFIKKTHYDVGMKQVKNEELQNMIGGSKALQEVMWSTSVQHGGGGAGSIFNKVYKPGMNEKDLIKAIYAERGTKFGSSTEDVRASVLQRFQKEQQQALEIAAQPKETLAPGQAPGENIVPPQQMMSSADFKAARSSTPLTPAERTTGEAIQDSAARLQTTQQAAATPQAPVINNITNNTGGGNRNNVRPAADVRNTDPAVMRVQDIAAAYG